MAQALKILVLMAGPAGREPPLSGEARRHSLGHRVREKL
jgi:hypothetical protein